MMKYNTIQYNTIQYNTIQYNTIQYNTIQYNTVQCSAVQCSAVQYSTVQYSTVQYSTVQYSTIQYNTILQHSHRLTYQFPVTHNTCTYKHTCIVKQLCRPTWESSWCRVTCLKTGCVLGRGLKTGEVVVSRNSTCAGT